MSYQAISNMAQSGSLRARLVACAAQEGIDQPEQFVNSYLWEILTQPGWADDWAYAEDNQTVKVNPDTGARTDVCSDAKILGAIQAVKSAHSTP